VTLQLDYAAAVKVLLVLTVEIFCVLMTVPIKESVTSRPVLANVKILSLVSLVKRSIVPMNVLVQTMEFVTKSEYFFNLILFLFLSMF
jgi:hypothetical protein